MQSDLDEETRKRGEQWARDQQSKLKQSAREKLHHLEKIANDHLSWFDQHNSIEKLIQTKRPFYSTETTTTAATAATTKRITKHTGITRTVNATQNNNSNNNNNKSGRNSTGSDVSMKTASEMNEETDDQIQLVQASRHHINSNENNNNNSNSNNNILRNSTSFHRSSNSSGLFQQLQQQHQQQKPTNSNSGKLSSNRNKKVMPPSLVTKEGNHNDLGGDEMDPDLYPTKIPEWAQSPELAQKLKLQKTADGNKIFGEMVPMEMSGIFGTRRRNKV